MKKIFLALALVLGMAEFAMADQWYGDQAYLRCNPDVQRELRRGGVRSAYDHYQEIGYRENRVTDGRCMASDAPRWFDEQCYMTQNPDVRNAVYSGGFMSGWHHYRVHGQYEGRQIECRDQGRPGPGPRPRPRW
jgi:hypothetical protein